MKAGWLSEKFYKKVIKTVPTLCADLIIRDRRGILMIKRTRAAYKGKWALVGGRVLYKEKLKDAVKRQAKTELGIGVSIKRFIGIYDDIRDPTKNAVSVCFLVSPGKGKIKLGTEGSEFKFFKKPPKDIAYHYKMMLKDAKIL